MKANFFDATDLISILSFLGNFKAACDSNDVHEGAAMWILPHFMKKPASVAVTSRLRLKKSEGRRSEGTLSSYCEVVNHLLGQYASDDCSAIMPRAIGTNLR